MSFAAMMMHVELVEPRDDRIGLAAGLSSRFHSTLIGATAWEPHLKRGLYETKQAS
jgi:hypothetical protein